MKCYDVRRKLSALLDSAAEGDLRDAVARHLDGCAACRAELAALASVDQAVARTLRAAEEPPPGYLDGVWHRLEPRLGPDPELDEIKKLAAEVVSHSGARSAPSMPAVATSLGQVVVPAGRPGRRRAPWLAFGGAAAAAAALLLGWVWLARGPQGERVQSPPTTGPEPPPVVAVAPPEPKPAETPAPPPQATPVAPAPAAPPPPKMEHRAGVPRHEPGGAAAKEAAAPAAETPAPKVEEMLVPPPPAQPEPVLPEKLAHEDIERGMVKIASRVQACFDLHAIEGKVMVKVKILPDGGVGAADVEGKAAGSEGGDCVAKAVREAKFSPFRGPPMTIRYPFQAE